MWQIDTDNTVRQSTSKMSRAKGTNREIDREREKKRVKESHIKKEGEKKTKKTKNNNTSARVFGSVACASILIRCELVSNKM